MLGNTSPASLLLKPVNIPLSPLRKPCAVFRWEEVVPVLRAERCIQVKKEVRDRGRELQADRQYHVCSTILWLGSIPLFFPSKSQLKDVGKGVIILSKKS
jgi:hypothetical protein